MNPGISKSWDKIRPVLLIGLTMGLAAGYAFTIGRGHAIDWRDFRLWTLGLPHEQGVWNPYWTKLVLFPLALLPQNIGHLLLNTLSLVTVVVVGRSAMPFLTNQLHSELWYGNLDGFIIAGIGLARLQNSYLVGVGLFLMSIKPQFLPAALYYIYQSRNIRLLVAPLLGFILSFVIYGNWLPEWLALMPPTPKPEVSISLYPWSLPVWFLLLLAKDKERFVITATALTMPYFNNMSLIVLFAFTWPWWIVLIFAVLGWFEVNSIIPVIALVYALFKMPQPWQNRSILSFRSRLATIKDKSR